MPFDTVSNNNTIHCKIPSFPLCAGEYYVNLLCRADRDLQDEIEYAFEFKVENGDFFHTGNVPSITDGVLVNHQWIKNDLRI
jgi:hypothetical protein